MVDFAGPWFPPSKENYDFVLYAWQFFPLFTAAQWLTDFYPQGKTSISSRLNLPGKYAWALMECPGMITVWYIFLTLPTKVGLPASSTTANAILGKILPFGSDIAFPSLPWGNYTLVGLYTAHYMYRAILAPLVLNPSMSPIHVTVFTSAFMWQVVNGMCIGGYVAGYGPVTEWDWTGRLTYINVGMVIWGWGLLANMFHDDDLREIRRQAIKRQKKMLEEKKKSGEIVKDGDLQDVNKIYMMPKNGLFHWIFYPHYLCEWIEWSGWWMIAGLGCVPARCFLINEISTMLPRALSGRRWYIEKFGKEKVGNKKAIIPGIL